MSAIEYSIDPGGAEFAAEVSRPGDLDQLRPLPRISIHGFCESEAMQRLMERCGQDRRMAKVSLRITGGSIAAAANMFASVSTPNLIILETATEPRSLLAELAPLAAVCDPSTKVVIIGRHNDIALYRELIRNGISEYMVAPVAMADLLGAIAAIFVDPEAEPVGRSLAFIGAKGGCGSSVIAHNCAWGISNLFSTETILADLDLPYGTANIDFDQDPPQGISEAVSAPDRLDEVFLDRLLTKCSEHLSLLAAPSMLDRAYDFEAGAFQPILEILQRSAPVSVLDIPHGWSDWTRSVLGEADEVVITAIPDLASLRNTKNLLDALKKLRPNDRAPHLVLNQVGMPKRPEIAPNEFCESLEIEAAAIIPFDAVLFGNAANSGRMIGEIDRKSPAAETFSQLAHLLTGRTAIKKARRGGLGKVLAKLGRR
ncbi:CtpF protein [Sinorhizobium fredii USDA 205]|uniref:CtpF protein n=1 Tax=Rhizobium fredii TaxID=380 RepID=A0A844AKH3_RHIFR|nr:CpaE family protein [Sinorhizobium fredii]AWM27167.1 Type II/IV secretion system ATPase TadZ/CpaE associated with Flp pilus assembly [Sinorhizobium fredii CCBAU 25509]KSV83328.1 CtpF protein [Sinorhizobium fredii USDA 205]MCG5474706.1 CpaE family protein [Sinorhizobium fredii]MQW97730.1 CtpF protein [Sinorhizobium fredii]MQX11936.1 CtpF protein [Sinorhizobium fredii]